MADEKRVTFEGALEVLTAIAQEHLSATSRPLSAIVTFGGTALAAHKIRDRSDDVDIYLSEVDINVLECVTDRFRPIFGPEFKIDATPSNTIFGPIALLDIERAPIVAEMSVGGHVLAVRALDIETLYLAKTAADRPKDRDDRPEISIRTTYDKVVARARQTFPWHADRTLLPAYVERLERYVARDFHVPLAQVGRDFALPESIAKKISEMRNADEAHHLQILKAAMRERPDLIQFNERRPDVLTFNPPHADPDDPITLAARKHPQMVSDMAAEVLKQKDPKRHFARLKAIKANKLGGIGE